MLSTNFALRPLIKEEGDIADAWEILKVLNDDTNTVFSQRVGIVESPPMQFTPITMLQFLLGCYKDQHPEIIEGEVIEDVPEETEFRDV
jgi:hypothetical protein